MYKNMIYKRWDSEDMGKAIHMVINQFVYQFYHCTI